jgi:hypothetical protein
MHKYINKVLLHPNSFLQLLWPKTILGYQHVHHKHIWNLNYAFKCKSEHKSRLNISNKDKFMTNIVKLNLFITWTYPQVEHKNQFIFCYKKSIRQEWHKYKVIHIKDLHSNFVQIFFPCPANDITNNISQV